MEEAERCDRVGILHQGKLIALDTPDKLKSRVGGEVVVIRTQNASALREKLMQRFACEPMLVDGTLRVERSQGHEFVREIFEAFPERFSLSLLGGRHLKTCLFTRPASFLRG
jgi:ABC-2 type transport system ATP-binding protein